MILNKEPFDCSEVTLISKNGDSKDFILRPFGIGVEEGIKECVTEEYGTSYFKKDFYDVNKIRENALSDHYRFFVAEADGEIACLEIFHIFNGDEDYIEPASQIIKKRYRNYGLAVAMINYTFACAKLMNPAALFVHAVTFHIATQYACKKYGMVPAGFRLGSFLTEKMHNSYVQGKCDKYSEGVMILPIAKRDAGTIYLPEEVEAFAEKIYSRLQVNYNIGVIPDDEELATIVEYMSDNSLLDIKKDADQRIVLVKVLEMGRDIPAKMKEIIESFGDDPDWVIQITLSINEKCIYYIYNELKNLNFFCTGLKPLCGKDEKMYMQWLGDTNLNMGEYVLTDDFEEIRYDIEKFMTEVIKGE